MMRAWEDIYEQGLPFATISDATAMEGTPSALLRRRLSEWSLANASVANPLTLSNQLVMPNMLLRGAVKAMDWIFEPTTPREIAATYALAEERCVAALRAHGLSIGGDR